MGKPAYEETEDMNTATNEITAPTYWQAMWSPLKVLLYVLRKREMIKAAKQQKAEEAATRKSD